LGIVSELVAEDAEGGRRIAKTAGDVAGGLLLDEESAESFVLTLQGELGGEEEFLVRGCDDLIHSTGRHDSMVLPKHSTVKTFLLLRTEISTKCLQILHIMASLQPEQKVLA
jgi:hypothetical protein